MELHCNLSRLEQEAQTRLASSDTLTPEETAYYGALVDYAIILSAVRFLRSFLTSNLQRPF